MIHFERSVNYELIASILTNASVYRRMVNDEAPAPEDLFVGPVAGITYVIAFDEDGPIALFLLAGNRHAPGISEIHFCFIPEAWGRTGQIAQEFLEWVWRETSLYKLVGPLPSFNRLAYRLATSVGFKQYAVSVNAGKRNGRPFDLLYLEIRRPESKGATA